VRPLAARLRPLDTSSQTRKVYGISYDTSTPQTVYLHTMIPLHQNQIPRHMLPLPSFTIYDPSP
jgi:hypothetical protein